jgi:hypothetical protein
LTPDPLVKLESSPAAGICANFRVSSEAKKLLRDGMSSQEFVGALVEKKRYVDAIDFMAHALPARQGIWWGCLCMQHALGENLAPPDKAAATAAVQWVLQPTEENRAAAGSQAEAAPPPSIGGALATAAFHTGGNIAPPNLNIFRAPQPFAPAKSIALAVKLAAVKVEPAKIVAAQRSYVDLALEVATGRLI